MSTRDTLFAPLCHHGQRVQHRHCKEEQIDFFLDSACDTCNNNSVIEGGNSIGSSNHSIMHKFFFLSFFPSLYITVGNVVETT